MGSAKSKNETGHLWAEAGEPRVGPIAEVVPVLPVDRSYSFALPDDLAGAVAIGQRVEIPFGRNGRLVVGFVVGLDTGPWEVTLRPVESVVDSASFMSPELVELGRQIAEHYACPLGQTLKAMTPDAVRRERGLRKVRFVRLLISQPKIEEDGTRISPARRAILEQLGGADASVRVDDVLRFSGSSASVLRAMAKRGWVEITERRELAEPDALATVPSEPNFELNDEQRRAVDEVNRALDDERFSVSLLYGVSGSGKTEVYIRAIQRVVAAGCQAILLVPEIVLTTQLADRLSSRFASVALMHSGLTESQRSVMWRRIASGAVSVVVGTRSAVFAPCPRLGLICVDEEQESSYKNLQAPRFHVRDVAIMRAQKLGIPIVLGSATPSLETWHRSEFHADYRRLFLTRRVRDLPMPKVHLVDMRDEIEQSGRVVLSRMMVRLLKQSLEREEQALILMNRRGFAHKVFCASCRSRLECPRCSVGLVVHSTTGHSVCHYCRERIETPTVCPNPSCRQPLVQLGAGTQRVEEVLAKCFPKARIQRVDSDTMRHRAHYQHVVDDFEFRKIDILVGTQMIAKGLDFPFVSFVGVIQADPTGLASDFRAQERLFQLVTQVAGRAGRSDRPGTVVVQAMEPELPALRCALSHDYESFVAGELPIRQRTGFPPFGRIARLIVSDGREEQARQQVESTLR